MINLPEWKLTLVPPLYDTASKSPIEMTAQVYAKMRELIEAFNELDSKLGNQYSDFTNKIIANVDEFEKSVTCLMESYIQSIDSKVAQIELNAEKLINEKFEVIVNYNEEIEEVVIGGY